MSRRRYTRRGRGRTGLTRTAGYYGRFNRPAQRLQVIKFHDLTVSEFAVSTTGSIQPSLNLIPQGVSEIQRLGIDCVIKSIHCKYAVRRQNSTSQVGHNALRFIIYVDKQANGAAATVGALLDSTAGAPTYHQFKNLEHSDRFVILYDNTRTFNLSGEERVPSTDVLTTYGTNTETQVFLKVNLPLHFGGSTGAISELLSNNIGICYIAQNTNMVCQADFRVRFIG